MAHPVDLDADKIYAVEKTVAAGFEYLIYLVRRSYGELQTIDVDIEALVIEIDDEREALISNLCTFYTDQIPTPSAYNRARADSEAETDVKTRAVYSAHDGG